MTRLERSRLCDSALAGLALCAVATTVWLAAALLSPTTVRAQSAFRQAAAIDTFMRALMTGDIKRAYALTGRWFKEKTSEQRFTTFAKKNRLAEITSYYAVDLSSLSLNADNNVADVRVVIRWLSQERMLAFHFGRDANQHWRIASLRRLGTQPSPPIRPEDMKARFGVVPAEERLTDMVRTAFSGLADGLHRKDMAQFYATTSQYFRNDYTLKTVEDTFLQSQFARASIAPIDWSNAGKATITFSEKAKIDVYGTLIVATKHVFGDVSVEFITNFVIEGPDWELSAFRIRPFKQEKREAEPPVRRR